MFIAVLVHSYIFMDVPLQLLFDCQTSFSL